MRYKTNGSSLDNLITPIIICDSTGRVIYKNEIAVKQVRLPRRNTDMKIHLDGGGRGELQKISKSTRPGVITVYTGDRNAKGFVSAYERDGKDCTLWMFPAFLQLSPSSAYFSALDKDLEKIGFDFSAIVKDLDRQSTTLTSRGRTAIQKKIEQRIAHLVEDLVSGRNDRANWPVDESLNILKQQIGRIFAEQGYRIEYSEDVSQGHLRKYLNFRDFLAFYSHALTFCCELTRNRRIALDVKSAADADMLEFRIRFTMLFPPMYTESDTGAEKDIYKLMPYVPDHQVEIILFDKLIEFCDYEIAYSITEKQSDNVEFLFRVPLTVNRGFAAMHSAWESDLMQSDCDYYLRSMLLFSNFRNEPEEDSDE